MSEAKEKEEDLDSFIRLIRQKTLSPKSQKESNTADRYTNISKQSTRQNSGSFKYDPLSRQSTFSRTISIDSQSSSPDSKPSYNKQLSKLSIDSQDSTLTMGSKISKKLSKRQVSVNRFFEGLTLCFIPYLMDFTKGQIQVMQDLALKRGAQILPTASLSFPTQSEELYIITSKMIPSLEALVQTLLTNNNKTLDISKYKIIDSEWISQCMIADFKINPSTYMIDFSQSPNKRLNTKKSVLDPVIITIDEEEKEKEEETASGTSGGSGIDPHELKRLRREVKKKINSRNITNCRYLYDYLYETVEQKHENVEQKHETASRRSSTTKIENNGSDRKSNQSPNYTRGDTILLSDGESPSKGLKAVKRESGMSEEAEGGEFWNKKQKFVCQAPTQTSNLNEHLTEPLEKLFNAYVAQGDKGHAHGYRKTIAFIKVYPKKVENLSDLDDMKQLGAKMREKVKEILRTGQLRQANMLTNNAQVATLETFTKIWGVGPEKANRLYAQGMRTLEDLQKNQHLLSDIQKVGLKYVEDFDIKMTRQEVESIVAIIKAKIDELHGPDTYNICITGSYRRGREMCGDVDIVMAPKDDRPSEHFPTALVHALEGSLFIDHFSMPQPKFGCQSYIGVALLPSGTPRKVDIKHYPREMFGLGVLYFTGSGNYYRSMRELAQSLGYTLSDEGLAPIDRTEHNKGYPLGKVMPCYTEEDIFKYFGLQWKDPTERDLG